ncbi:MAG: PilN domain-containing protein [Anaeromyxobacter sp.]
MVRINLLPVRVSKKKEAGLQQLVLLALILVLGVLGNWYAHSTRDAELVTKQKKIASTKKDIEALDRTIGQVKSLAADKADLKKKLDTLEVLKKGRSGPVRMLDDLATITPKRLWLTKLDEKGGKITFEGTGGTIDDVSELMKKLKDSKYFADVELKKTETKVVSGMKVVHFTLTATPKYAPAVEPAAAAGKGGASPRPGRPASRRRGGRRWISWSASRRPPPDSRSAGCSGWWPSSPSSTCS